MWKGEYFSESQSDKKKKGINKIDAKMKFKERKRKEQI